MKHLNYYESERKLWSYRTTKEEEEECMTEPKEPSHHPP